MRFTDDELLNFEQATSSKSDPALNLPEDWQSILSVVEALLTTERKRRIAEVLESRTMDVVPVFEDIADPHNAAAVLRTAEALGLLYVHIIENQSNFKIARGISKGAHQWLELVRHDSAQECVRELRKAGYKIAITDMAASTRADQLDDSQRWAIVFGNEHHGVSECLRSHADAQVAVPMHGFVESLNLSVAAALTLNAATSARRRGLPEPVWQQCYAKYALASIKRAPDVVSAIQKRLQQTAMPQSPSDQSQIPDV